MDDHELPADLSRWPRDPYRLLGVWPGIAPRDLKRAYLRLVRQYKPEHAPEAFRRIREAYEAIQQNGRVSMPPSLGPKIEENEPTPVVKLSPRKPTTPPRPQPARPPEPGPRVPAPPVPTPPAPTRLAPPEEPWDIACRGNLPEAYRRLVAHVEQTPGREELYLQLYWLLLTEPKLDTRVVPADWLIRGLSACEAARGLQELVRRELTFKPSEALDDRYEALLQPGAWPDLAVAVAEARWRDARAAGRWGVILADIRCLRPWLGTADDDAWCRLLLNAAEHLAWSRWTRRPAVRSLIREVDRHSHQSRNYSEDLFRIDFVRELATTWRTLRTHFGAGTAEVRALLPIASFDPVTVFRDRLRSHLGRLARKPTAALRFMDGLLTRSPLAVTHLETLVTRLRQEEPIRHRCDHTDIVGPVIKFLAGRRWWNYNALRPRLLQFCLREAIDPARVASALANRDDLELATGQRLSLAIAIDRPLRYVYQACETMWG